MYEQHGAAIAIVVIVVAVVIDELVEDDQRVCSRPMARIGQQAAAFYYRQISLEWWEGCADELVMNNEDDRTSDSVGR